MDPPVQTTLGGNLKRPFSRQNRVKTDFSPKVPQMTQIWSGERARVQIRHFRAKKANPMFSADFCPTMSDLRPWTLPGANMGHFGHFWRKVCFYPILVKKKGNSKQSKIVAIWMSEALTRNLVIKSKKKLTHLFLETLGFKMPGRTNS